MTTTDKLRLWLLTMMMVVGASVWGQSGDPTLSIRPKSLISYEAGEDNIFGIEVTPTRISIDKEGGSKTFEVASNVAWKAESNQTWLTISGGSGSGNGTVTVTAPAYNYSESRKATVTVSGQGLTKIVTVTQLGDVLTLEVTPTSISTDAEGGSKTFEVASNVMWKARIDHCSPEGWITIGGDTLCSGDGTVIVTANPIMKQYGTHAATVVIEGQGLKRSVSVFGYSPVSCLEIFPPNIRFDKEGGSKTFAVASNDEWTVVGCQSWLTVNPTSGEGNGEVIVAAESYTDTQSRSAEIKVRCVHTGIEQSILVTQSSDGNSSIELLQSNGEAKHQLIYNLNGRIVQQRHPGIYIVNGKILFVK